MSPIRPINTRSKSRSGSPNLSFAELRIGPLLAVILLLAPAEFSSAQESSSTTEPLFVERAEATGLDFVHFNGMSGELYFPEMTGQGGALFDYDGDGDLDVYLVQGSMIGPGKTLDDALEPPPGPRPPRDRLFRNDLTIDADGKRSLHFVDVTAAMGAVVDGYGMAVAAGDVDNDGRIDLFVAQYGENRLLMNRGGGRFEDATPASGLGGSSNGRRDSEWSTGASFFDFDADGWLDLFVVNYVDFDLAANPACYAPSSRRDYCGPSAFTPQADRLYRNRGDGTFEDATSRLRGARPGPGLGVVAADFDDDGDLDLFVANDGEVNQLWAQQADGSFRDEALLAGVALNGRGSAEASMGVATADIDDDGDLDLFLAHLTGETNTYYRNVGRGLFEDRTAESRLGPASVPWTAFGTDWLDVDNDGRLDLIVVNGAVRLQEADLEAGDRYPLGQPNQLFLQSDSGQFREAEGGPSFDLSEVSRGLAVGDIDNDGDSDALILNNNGRVRLLINQVGQQAPWIGLRLVEVVGDSGRRDALGATVTLQGKAGPTPTRRAATDGSYASSSDPRVIFGLGNSGKVDHLDVCWSDGRREQFPAPPPYRYAEIVRGQGRPSLEPAAETRNQALPADAAEQPPASENDPS